MNSNVLSSSKHFLTLFLFWLTLLSSKLGAVPGPFTSDISYEERIEEDIKRLCLFTSFCYQFSWPVHHGPMPSNWWNSTTTKPFWNLPFPAHMEKGQSGLTVHSLWWSRSSTPKNKKNIGNIGWFFLKYAFFVFLLLLYLPGKIKRIFKNTSSQLVPFFIVTPANEDSSRFGLFLLGCICLHDSKD